MNRIFKAPDFEKNARKLLSHSELIELDAVIISLKNNLYLGKPLGVPFLREKRIKNKRIYFLVYEEHNIILVVGVSDKKTQQSTIEKIKS